MSKNRKKHNLGRTLGIMALAFIGFVLLLAKLLHGHNIALLNPKGMIAHEQLNVMLISVGVLLVIAIPTMFVLYFTAWKYRESNTKAARGPITWYGKPLNIGVWLIPGIFALVMALIMWPATHRLAPQKSIVADAKPLTIQVVSMRWKWLFIYPEQKIATVNFVQIPVGTPVQFNLTADDAPMSSFWIPNLSGMLYTMTGHSNRLNLMADTLGDYPGRSGEINGAGFAGMQFTARASSYDDFNRWVQGVQSSGKVLDSTAYNALLQPSQSNPAAFYSSVEDDLYGTVVMKYMSNMSGMDMGANESQGGSHAGPEHGHRQGVHQE